MTDDLSEFFQELAKEKKQKKEEFNELVGDLNLDSIFSEVSSLKKESKKKKVEEKKAIKAFEEFLFSEEESVEKEEKAEEAIREWIEDPVEEVVEEPEVESEPEEDLIEKSLGLLAEPEPEQQFATLDDLSKHYKIFIDKIQQQLSTLGGGGEVRLEFLDDVNRDSAKVDGKFLKYDANTGKFIGDDPVAGASEEAQKLVLDVRNNNVGYALTIGTPVYETDYNSGQDRINVEPSAASQSSTMPAKGVIKANLNNNTNGEIIVYGELEGVNTSSFDVADELYVAAAGGLTNTRPSGENDLVQKIAVVLKKSVNGAILVYGAGRTNDVPNKISIAGSITASEFHGDGSNLSGIVTSISSGIATEAVSAGIATFATTAGIASNAYWVKTDVGIHTLSSVGIATTNPQEKLHIHEGDVVIGQDSGNNTGITNHIKFGRVDAPKAAIGFINNLGSGRGDIIFMNNNDGDSSEFDGSDERVRITSSGLVGIGTSSPDQELEVFSDAFTAIRIKSSRTELTDQIGGVGFSTSSDQVATINSLVDGTIVFKNTTSDTERARITSSGNIEVADGNLVFSTSGTGINLGNDTLDQYDEGSFTPTYQTADDNISNVNYDAQTGHYTRIGNMCYFIMRLRTSSIGNVGSGVIEVHGLPFTHVNNASNRAVVLLTTSGWTDGNAPTLGFFYQNTNTFKLTQKSASQDPTNLPSSVLNTSGNKNEIRVTGMYRCL